jgi:hypothetical protein
MPSSTRWDHNDFEERVGADRLATLRRHITEVRGAIGPDTSGRSHSRSSGGLPGYLTELMARLRELESDMGVGPSRGRVTTLDAPGRRGTGGRR